VRQCSVCCDLHEAEGGSYSDTRAGSFASRVFSG
jgi:hypothetical protein